MTTTLAIKPAAIYARQSRTDESKEDRKRKDQKVETTLDTQSAACTAEAKKRGYSVHPGDVFTERYTGAEMWDRPVLSELRRRIKSREFKALVVYSTDRLAREPTHLALILEECQRVNCELVFVTEPLEDSPEGELILYIKGYAAKIERLRIKDRMARGRNAILAAGKLTCQGNAAYGYKFDSANRVRVIDEQAASVVRDIFRWTIEGQSAHTIAANLNRMRVPPPAIQAGKRMRARPIWNPGAVSRLLKDESYTGVTFVNKFRVTEVRDKKTGRYFSAKRDRSEWRTLPAGVTPAIIEKETYVAARKAVERNMRKSDNTRNGSRPVLLRGIVVCSHCSSPLYAMSEPTYRKDDPTRATYKCAASRLKRSRVYLSAPPAQQTKTRVHIEEQSSVCRAKRVIAAGLENSVWERLVQFILNPRVVEREVEKVLSATPDNSLANDLAGAEKQLIRARRLRDNHLIKYDDAVADGDDEMAARWDSKVNEATSDIKALTSVIADLTARLSAYSNAGKTARAFAARCRAVMAAGSGEFTFEERRAALEALNVKVFAADGLPIRVTLNTALLTEQDVTVEVCV